MSGWRETTLGEFADFRNGKAISPEKYTATGRYPVIGSNGQIAHTNEVLNFQPVIVIGRVGAYCGCVHYVSRASWVTDNAIIALPKDVNDTRYLFYLLSSLELERTAIGSAQPLMTQGGLKVVRATVPPPAEQRAIASVLGSLDDKIELNRRMNETLEALAQSLFKSWFVDATQSALPKGWHEVELGDLLQFEKGKKPPTAVEIPEVGFKPIILIETFDSGKSAFAPPENMLEANSQDVLMVMDGASSGRVETGFAGLVGSTIAKIVPRRTVPGSRFLYYALKQLEPETRQHLTGTSIPHTDKQWIVRQTVNLPSDETVIKKFESTAASIRLKIELNRAESRTLAALRDALLPKLLSGELRVPAAMLAAQACVPTRA